MSQYCPHCFTQNEDGVEHCAHCGGVMNIQNRKNHLPVMNILIGRYLIGKTLGEGGFGITYAGYDLRLEKMVAIKEYYPNGIAMRMDTLSCTVEASSDSSIPALQQGKEKFLTEARTMSRFNKLHTVVDVLDFFEANGTAYIVMEYLDGVSLGKYLKQHGPEQDFNTLYAMLRPVMEDLDRIHREKLIHRDISPSNLMLLKDGTVKLLDFGTARNMSEEGEKSLSVVLKHGYAPLEQYSRRGEQGAWTDVYALCATIYKLLTGITPESAMDRLTEDTLKLPSQLGVTISKTQEQTLLRGLALKFSDRIQTLAELMAGFEGDASKPVTKDKEKEPETKPVSAGEEEKRKKDESEEARKGKTAKLLLLIGGLVAAAILALTLLPGRTPVPAPTPEPTPASAPIHAANVGELVTFGSYEQDNNTANGTEPIQWRVLAKEENRILVISEYALETRPYNKEYTSITWENCTLRTWLNEEFYNAAFTAEEQALIPKTSVEARPNPKYSTDPGKDTPEKVFLLSIQEANEYFPTDEARQCAPTAYTKAQRAWKRSEYVTASGEAACWWWLRSPGFAQNRASGVSSGGSVSEGGDYVDYNYGCVRPAMWINLETAPPTPGPTLIHAAANVGDLVSFGSYEQDNNTANGTESIQWRVLAKEENRILVISEYALETKPYNEENKDVTWETCTLHSWLNEEFYNAAFTAEEQALIHKTAVKAHPNPRYSTDPGKDTQDKVFLLSIQEANEYFTSDEARQCAPTAYAKAQGAWTSSEYITASGEAACWWWLRSPGNYQDHAAGVYRGGSVYERGARVNNSEDCVRPAMWIDLDA